jgi:hypothetical protein
VCAECEANRPAGAAAHPADHVFAVLAPQPRLLRRLEEAAARRATREPGSAVARIQQRRAIRAAVAARVAGTVAALKMMTCLMLTFGALAALRIMCLL